MTKINSCLVLTVVYVEIDAKKRANDVKSADDPCRVPQSSPWANAIREREIERERERVTETCNHPNAILTHSFLSTLLQHL